jgi:hypothetical protein
VLAARHVRIVGDEFSGKRLDARIEARPFELVLAILASASRLVAARQTAVDQQRALWMLFVFMVDYRR